MDLKTIVMNVFMIIGMIVCVVVTAVALVWLTCFVVRILIKSFSAKVNSYTEIIVEDIKEKAIIKKELKQRKREAMKAQKEELLRVQLASKKRLNDMKKKKLREKLKNQEVEQSLKLFGSYEEPQNTYEEEETDEIPSYLKRSEDNNSFNENSNEPNFTENNEISAVEEVTAKMEEPENVEEPVKVEEQNEPADVDSYASEMKYEEDVAEEEKETDEDEEDVSELQKEIAKRIREAEENTNAEKPQNYVDDEEEKEDFDSKFKNLTGIDVEDKNTEKDSEQNDEDDFDFNKFMQEEYATEEDESEPEVFTDDDLKKKKKKSKK